MNAYLDPASVAHTLTALEQFPNRVRFKHVRIGLNAAGGVFKRAAQQEVLKETRTLERSMAVRVKIPDTSYNTAHHGRPAYIVIGHKRRYARYVRRTKAGNLRGVSERKALENSRGVRLRVASRYAHLAERKKPHMKTAQQVAAMPAAAAFVAKVRQGAIEEANKLATGSPA